MAVTLAPHAHKVRLREVATGAVIERWPVDARELIAVGSYVLAEDEAPATTTASPAAPTADGPSGTSGDTPAATGAAAGDGGAAVPKVPDPTDPMPHVTKALAQNAALSPTGAPLVIAPATGVSAAAPVQLPQGRTPPPGSPTPATPKGARR